MSATVYFTSSPTLANPNPVQNCPPQVNCPSQEALGQNSLSILGKSQHVLNVCTSIIQGV